MADNAPESVEGLLESGLTALDEGDFEVALARWNRVLEIEPGNARAAHLVDDLERLVRESEAGTATSSSGEFVVVVDADDAQEMELAGRGANVISRSAVERLEELLTAAGARADELAEQVGAVEAKVLELEAALLERDREILAEREARLESERKAHEVSKQQRADESFARQRELRTAGLEGELAEARAAEHDARAEAARLGKERDALEARVAAAEKSAAEASEAREALETSVAEIEEARAAAVSEHESLRTQLAAAEQAAEEARAAAEAARSASEGATEQEAALVAKLEEAEAALAAKIAVVEALERGVVEAESERDAALADLSALEARVGELESTVAEQEAEMAKIGAELHSVATEADAKVKRAQEELSEAQAARSAMRAEMATVVSDLEEEKTRSLSSEGELETLRALAAEAEAALAATRTELEATRKRAAAVEGKATTVAEQDATIARKSSRIAELEAALESVVTETESRGAEFQERIDALELKLAAALGRAEQAEKEAEGLQTQIDLLKGEPVTMKITTSLPTVGPEREGVDSDSVTGVFQAAEDAKEAIEAATARGRESASRRGVPVETHPGRPRTQTTGENSALIRLNDHELTPQDRLSWLIDEAPYVARMDGTPKLSAQAAFVLQNIDGTVSFADLIDIVGLPSEETSSILVDLLQQGIITSPTLAS